MNSSKTNKLPVFPLGLVVLPGTIQTLQIFEPRYLSMVKDCMNSESGFVITLSNDNVSGESFMSQGTFVDIIDFNIISIDAQYFSQFCLIKQILVGLKP